jgi:hypothetical protein
LFFQSVESLKIEQLSTKQLRIEDSQQSNTIQGKDLDDQFLELRKRLDLAKSQKRDCAQRKERLTVYSDDRRVLENCLLQKVNQISFDYLSLTEHSNSIKTESECVDDKLNKLMQQNAINDAFHIWYSGPFATINNFRLGTLAVRTIEWSGIFTYIHTYISKYIHTYIHTYMYIDIYLYKCIYIHTYIQV